MTTAVTLWFLFWAAVGCVCGGGTLRGAALGVLFAFLLIVGGCLLLLGGGR